MVMMMGGNGEEVKSGDVRVRNIREGISEI